MRVHLPFAIVVAAACTADGGPQVGTSFNALEPWALDPSIDIAGVLSQYLRPGERLYQSLRWSFPQTRRTLAIAVAVDQRGARRFEIDEHGAPADLAMVLTAEREAHRQAFGTMTERLYRTQEALPDTAQLTFAVMVQAALPSAQAPYDGTDASTSMREFTDWIVAHKAQKRATLAEIKRPLVEWLRAQGAEVYEMDGMPVIAVRSAIATLRHARLRAADVAALDYFDDGSAQPLLAANAHVSMREQLFVGGDCGAGERCDGEGFGVGVWEQQHDETERTGMATGHPFLSGFSVNYFIKPKSCRAYSDCPTGVGANFFACHG